MRTTIIAALLAGAFGYILLSALALVILGRATKRAAEPLPPEMPGDATPCVWPGLADPYAPSRGRGMEWDDADAREVLPPSAFTGAGDRGTRRALAAARVRERQRRAALVAANRQQDRARDRAGRVRVWGRD